ncbi:hypothetical protein AB6G46_15930 [Providencia hangzhouensis]|uniref:hypothetical protein n=1 Tax=Providencia hangzhouensis TaxID=3031799 RepID=UPI0034DD66B0
MPNTSTATLPVFRPGTHTAMDGRQVTITLEDCLDLAASYDPTLMETPFVIGHPKLTAPSYGWAGRFEVRDGLLYAEPKQVVPEFAEAFNKGMYKKRSLSIYFPNSPGNPKPGHFYPRHVGFLGAMPPAVKGLPDVSFAECDGDLAPVEFALPWEVASLVDTLRAMRDYLIEKDGLEKANLVLPQWRIDDLATSIANSRMDDAVQPISYSEGDKMKTTEPTPPTDFAEREAQIQARENDLKAREQKIKDDEAQRHRQEVTDFADGLVKDGKLLPAQKNRVVEIFMNLPNGPVSFADGSATVNETPEALLRDVLQSRPAFLDFSEKSATDGAEPLDFADSQAMANAAQDYQAEQKRNGREISVTQAMAHIKGAKK